MYQTAIARLRGGGYGHYEVSNWSTDSSAECRHNLLYWRNLEWVGVGPGAHSHLRYAAGQERSKARLPFPVPRRHPEVEEPCQPPVAARWSNRKSVQGYIKRIHGGAAPVDFHEELTSGVSMGETMMLGLRLIREGVPFSRFERTHGQPMEIVFGPRLAVCRAPACWSPTRKGVRLTERGLFLGNRVFSEFVSKGFGAAMTPSTTDTEYAGVASSCL